MIGMKKVELGEIYGKEICGICESADENGIVLYMGYDIDVVDKIYKLNIKCDEHELSEFVEELENEIFDSGVSIKSIKCYKEISIEDSFCYAFEFDDLPTKFLRTRSNNCELILTLTDPCLKDLVETTLTSLIHNDDILDIYFIYNGVDMNLDTSLSENDVKEKIKFGDSKYIINEKLTDVTISYDKNKDNIPDEDKKLLISYYESDNPNDWECAYLTITFKSAKGEFGIIWLLLEYDESYDINCLQINNCM